VRGRKGKNPLKGSLGGRGKQKGVFGRSGKHGILFQKAVFENEGGETFGKDKTKKGKIRQTIKIFILRLSDSGQAKTSSKRVGRSGAGLLSIKRHFKQGGRVERKKEKAMNSEGLINLFVKFLRSSGDEGGDHTG